MFIPTLRSQTTDEQKKLFLEPALKHHIIGCYAQTEVSGGILSVVGQRGVWYWMQTLTYLAGSRV
jgi:alkylation response protein AidB-like acyl-CoA dehydrogenase